MRNMFLAILLCALPATASADLLYVQPSALSSARTSEFAPSANFGFRMFDDFVLASKSSVQSVRFLGAWVGEPGANLPAPSPDVSSWELTFYEDNAGLPGAVRASRTYVPGDLTLAFLGTVVFNFGNNDLRNLNIYDITATFVPPVTLQGGTRYWFSPLAYSDQFLPVFTWLGATLPSGTGNNVSIQQTLGAGMAVTATTSLGRDRSLQLDGAVVPEPGALVLIGTAAVGLLARRRSHRG